MTDYEMEIQEIDEIMKKIYDKIESYDKELLISKHQAFDYAIRNIFRHVARSNLNIEIFGNELHISSYKEAYEKFRGSWQTSDTVIVSLVNRFEEELLCIERQNKDSMGPHSENKKYSSSDSKEYIYYNSQGIVVAKKSFSGCKTADTPITYGSMSLIPISKAPNDEFYAIDIEHRLRFSYDFMQYDWEERLKESSQNYTLSPLVQNHQLQITVASNKEYEIREKNSTGIIDPGLQAVNAERDMRNSCICESISITGTKANMKNSTNFFVRGKETDGQEYRAKKENAIAEAVAYYKKNSEVPSDGFGTR